MLNPCAKNKLKQKRAEKQTPNLTIGKDEEKDVKKDQSMEDEENDNPVVELPGIPLMPHRQSSKNGVYFILEKASHVLAHVGKALLQIMSSRLCMAGRLHAVFIKTDEGILIRVEPHTHIPKTLGSFCNMMAELLQKFSIKSKGSQGKLLRVLICCSCAVVGLSFSSPKAVQLRDYVSATNGDENLVFEVGAMAHGKIDADYIDDLMSVSAYPLIAGTCLRRICIALERNWKIH
ncbi:hypothetical protein L6164_037417 [Bauhinia variegata]|uniref:Uncharacterized protein n=1 Tax=Bauhinia variegata TaxID=167791 RepID=A0ACB9KJZ9_BAUVA|nr:hypothetical protein L6164_037417 [Bauhinia variegata]